MATQLTNKSDHKTVTISSFLNKMTKKAYLTIGFPFHIKFIIKTNKYFLCKYVGS